MTSPLQVADGYVPAAGMVGVVPGGEVAGPHPFAMEPGEQVVRPPRRRIRGLQLRALPSAPMLAQLVGGGAAMYGVWLAFGTAVALIVGGVAAVALGALREAGKV